MIRQYLLHNEDRILTIIATAVVDSRSMGSINSQLLIVGQAVYFDTQVSIMYKLMKKYTGTF